MKNKIDLANYTFFLPLHLRWNDLDPLGHVNNVMYIEYFQIGRGEYMVAASKTWDWFQHMFVIANISCDYWKEMRLGVKEPRIGVRVDAIGTKSFTIEYAIISEGKDRQPILHASGSSTQVMIDVKAGKSIEVPDWLRAELTAFEPAL